MIRRIFAALPVLFVLAMPAHADFRSGVDAFKRGDYAVEKAEFEVLANQGMAAAQTNLGLMYSKGYGVPINEAEAVRWYLLAAEKDHPVAQNNLGYMHINGQGLPKDRVLGLMWLTFSSENGYARAAKAILVLEKSMTKSETELARGFVLIWKKKRALRQNQVSQLR
jgi:TPR repeat protein